MIFNLIDQKFQLFLIIGFSSFLTFIIIPLIIILGNKLNLIDSPNYRKQHKKSKINIGGLAMLIGQFLTILLIKDRFEIFSYTDETFWITIYFSIFLFFIGFIDDIRTLSPFLRMLMQIIIASFLWSRGFNVNAIDFGILNDGLNIYYLPDILSLLITIFWFVGLINAINWIDGLDGLAAGITIISSISFLIVNIISNNYNNAIIASILIGISISFYIYNKHPSKIFMGDGGSYFLGFLLASISFFGDHYTSQVFTGRTYGLIEIMIPLFILLVPILDMTYVIFSRIFLLKSPFFPDRRHIHHRFLNKGLSHKDAVNKIHLLTLASNVLGIMLIIKKIY